MNILQKWPFHNCLSCYFFHRSHDRDMISTNINLFFGEKIEPRIKPKSVNILRSVKHGEIKIIMVQTSRIKPKSVNILWSVKHGGIKIIMVQKSTVVPCQNPLTIPSRQNGNVEDYIVQTSHPIPSPMWNYQTSLRKDYHFFLTITSKPHLWR